MNTKGHIGPLFFLKDPNLVPIACQEAPMNRICLLLLAGNLLAGGYVSAQDLEPSKNIFSGMDMPVPPISAETATGAVSAAPPTAEQRAEQARQARAAVAASAAATTLYTEQTVTTVPSVALSTIQLYSQDELITWIAQHQHLKRVVADECQLTPDIEARAKVLMLPSYQYLWGDMLLTGTCVTKDVASGVDYMRGAAEQGFPAALMRLAGYYEKGRYVQVDKRQAEVLMHEAAALGYLEAQIAWVDMLTRGLGSPLDYEEAYSWLHHTTIADEKQHAEARRLLNKLAARMPAGIVTRAKAYRLN